jgi:hypothetical protein
LVAAGVTITAAAFPFVHYTDSSTVPNQPSIFFPGFGPSNGFAAEPVGVAVIAIAAGIALLVWTSRVMRAVAAGLLLACGAQTFLLFVGYAAFGLGSPSAQAGPGGFIGMLAGLLLIAGGVAAALTLFARETSPTV